MDFKIQIDKPFYHEIPNDSDIIESKKKKKIAIFFKLKQTDLQFIYNSRTNDLLKQIDGYLKFIFSPDKSQVFPITCSLWLPKLKVDTNSIDFGIVLVGQSYSKHFILKNVSKSNVSWSISELILSKNYLFGKIIC
jgi:hypothetical protein